MTMSMNNKATTIIILVVAASLLATGGDACAGARSMDMDDACHAATSGPVLFDICMRTLRRTSPGSSEVTSYAIGGTAAAAQSCGPTQDAIEDMLRDRTVTGDVRDVVLRCKDRYRTARGAIEGVKNQLYLCSLDTMEQGYMDAIAAIEACNENGPIGRTILYGMISSDRDMTMIALQLGKLLLTKA